jgi:hypothetical protein
MKTIETIKCHCGEPFQWEPSPDPAWRKYDIRPTSCPSCAEREEAELVAQREAEEARKRITVAQEKALDELPPLFRATDTAHPRFNLTAWNKVKDHTLTPEKPWLGLIGETGKCKTRMAALIAIEEIGRIAEKWKSTDWRKREPIFIFTTGYRICELASLVSTGSWEQKEEARKELERITTCDLLLVDDLGKWKLTDTVAATLFAIINERYADCLRTIWTANSTPEEIAAMMNSDMAAPLAGRLNDHSLIFRFK